MNVVAALNDFRKVLIALSFLLVFFIVLTPPQDADMWWHLAAGREMLEQGIILTTDIFSYTHFEETWTNAFWLSDIFLFLAYALAGYLGITLLIAFTAVLTMAVIYKHTSRNRFPLSLLIILLAAFAVAPVWTPRPQIFSFLLLAILDYGLKEKDGFILKRPWLLIVLFIVWANLHGGFIWGFLLLIAVIIGNGLDYFSKKEHSLSVQQLIQLGSWTLLAALAIAINPNGLSLWKLPFYTVDVSIRSITEWGSPDFHRLDLHPILWMLFLIIIGMGTSTKVVSWSSILKVIGFSYMAFVSQRSIGPFVVIAAPVVINTLSNVWAEWLSLLSRLFRPRLSRAVPATFGSFLNLLILGLFVVLIMTRAYSVSTLQQIHSGLPLKAVEWIRENQPEGRMFNAYNWGGYLQWQLPEYPVFIDGRADLHGEKTINDWWNIVNATDQDLSLLDSWQVNFVILEPGWPILERLNQDGWRVLYEDNIAVIMGR